LRIFVSRRIGAGKRAVVAVPTAHIPG
jgi:hypothetical protein